MKNLWQTLTGATDLKWFLLTPIVFYTELEAMANTLDAYRRFRHDAIYGLDFIMDEVEAKASLDFAKEFVEKIGIIIDIDKK